MIKGVGIDLVEISRVRAALEKWGERFENRILTAQEMRQEQSIARRTVFLAGRFAAKEAVFKSLGISPCWHKILILTGEKGEPVVKLSPVISEKIKDIKKVLVSITHSKNYALAQAIAIG